MGKSKKKKDEIYIFLFLQDWKIFPLSALVRVLVPELGRERTMAGPHGSRLLPRVRKQWIMPWRRGWWVPPIGCLTFSSVSSLGMWLPYFIIKPLVKWCIQNGSMLVVPWGMKEREACLDFPVKHTWEKQQQPWGAGMREGWVRTLLVEEFTEQRSRGSSDKLQKLEWFPFGTFGKTAGNLGLMGCHLHAVKYSHCIHTV